VKSRIAYVPDAIAFYPWMTVAGQVAFARTIPTWATFANLPYFAAASVVPWFVYFSYANHRFPERSIRLLWRQALPIVVSLVAVLTLMATVLTARSR
jgi:hypothetical protein